MHCVQFKDHMFAFQAGLPLWSQILRVQVVRLYCSWFSRGWNISVIKASKARLSRQMDQRKISATGISNTVRTFSKMLTNSMANGFMVDWEDFQNMFFQTTTTQRIVRSQLLRVNHRVVLRCAM